MTAIESIRAAAVAYRVATQKFAAVIAENIKEGDEVFVTKGGHGRWCVVRATHDDRVRVFNEKTQKEFAVVVSWILYVEREGMPV